MRYFYTVILFFAFYVVNGQTFLKDFYSITELVSLNDHAFFIASDAKHGTELWKTNGTKEGTYLVKDINTLQSSSPQKLVVFNGEIYFSANDGVFGHELWKTNGTEQGTYMVKNIHQALGGSSNPSDFTIYNDQLYFTATDNYLGGGYQLWKTDGTENGTLKVHDAGGSVMSQLVAVNNKLFFLLGRSSLMVYDLDSGVTEIPPDSYYYTNRLMAVDNNLYYTTHTSNSTDIRVYKLGEDNISVLLQEFSGGPDFRNFTKVGSDVYFSITRKVNSGNDTDDLWKTDGTTTGTALVKRFTYDAHLYGSHTTNFVAYKDELFFRSGNTLGHQLWKSDGTNAGTVKVVDMSIDPSANFVVFNDLLFFVSGQKIWSIDGTMDSVKKVSDLPVAFQGSEDFFSVKAAGDKLYFKAAYQDKKALYTTEANPIIEVKKGNLVLLNQSDVYFESKIDSVVKTIVSIKNIGNKALVFSKIKVVGQDFYINGEISGDNYGYNPQEKFPQTLPPGAQSKLELSFYPSTEGSKKGTLSLFSNDDNFPNFEIELTGFSENEIGQNSDELISLDKEIDFNTSDSLIKLDNTAIKENSPINAQVGVLSVPNSADSYRYELNSDNDFPDNAFFTIDNNQLKSKGSLNFEQKNTYVISVTATNNATNILIDQRLTIHVLDVVEAPVLKECSVVENNMGFGLNDVTFIDNQNVVAVGSHGVILKSDDAGNTWRKVKSGTYDHLIDVQFTTPAIGYAIGENIMKTEDGGETWFTLKLTNASYPKPTHLFFVNSEVGFVFGRDGKVYSTTDGGRYWKQKNMAYTDYSSAHFFNESKGFLVGNTNVIYKTLDGGDAWEIIDLKISGFGYNEGFTKIHFISDAVGFMASSSGKIVKTVDGGDTWTLVSTLQYGSSVKDLSFQDENNGYALTENKLYKTTDGGVTWVNDELQEYYFGLQGISFSPDSNKSCIVGHGASCCVGATTGHVIYTKESDNPWKNISYLSLGYHPYGSVFMEGNLGLVFGSNAGSRSFDGGITWETILAPTENVRQIEVINNTIYLTGQDGFYKSRDYGDTWIFLNNSNFRKLFFINEQIIYATSDEGMLKSIDGGVNWTLLTTETGTGFDLFFKNENEGYVGTIVYGMFKTLDGGATWSNVSLEPSEEIMSVYSVNIYGAIGFAGTSSGLFKTLDGGISWERTYQTLPRINFIKSINAVEWYLVSEEMIFKTEDAGENWNMVSHNSDDITAAHFGNEKLYVVGYRTFLEIGGKDEPYASGPITGPVQVSAQSTEHYSVTTDADVYYKWTVSGENDISYSDNKAEVIWNTAGTFRITATPYDNCSTGNIRELTVTVKEEALNLTIQGDDEVDEFSTNHNYNTTPNAELRYVWRAKGHQDFTSSNNLMTVQWGQSGSGKVQLIATNETTGLRKEAFLDVTINATSLQSDNFNIEVVGETCPGSKNGVITISAIEEHDYVMTINGTIYNFTQSLTIENLAPTDYEFCIAVPKLAYQQCYSMVLPASESILGRSAVQSEIFLVNMDKGTAPYKVIVNGDLVLETTAASFSVNVQHGDSVEVKTDKACEGSMFKTIDLLRDFTIYPNPTHGDFQIKVPLSLHKVTVELYSTHLQLISSNNYTVVDGKIQLSLANEPSGLYLVKIHSDKPVLLKLLKL